MVVALWPRRILGLLHREMILLAGYFASKPLQTNRIVVVVENRYRKGSRRTSAAAAAWVVTTGLRCWFLSASSL